MLNYKNKKYITKPSFSFSRTPKYKKKTLHIHNYNFVEIIKLINIV